MKRAYGLEIPESVEEAIDLDRTALLVYDMQVGILRQLRHGGEIITKVADVLAVAREVGLRTCFLRHTSLPKNLMGVFQMRQALAWQRKAAMDDVHPWFFMARTHTPSRLSSHGRSRGRIRQDSVHVSVVRALRSTLSPVIVAFAFLRSWASR